MNAETNEQLERICGLIGHGLSDSDICPYLVAHVDSNLTAADGGGGLIGYGGIISHWKALERIVGVVRAMVHDWTPPDKACAYEDVVRRLVAWADTCLEGRQPISEGLLRQARDVLPKAEIKKDQGVQVLAEEAFLHGVANGTRVLTSPLNEEQLQSLVDNDGFIKVRIYVNLNDIISDDLETFTDRISLLSVGLDIMEDISYSVVGHCDGTVIIEVCGQVNHILNDGASFFLGLNSKNER